MNETTVFYFWWHSSFDIFASDWFTIFMGERTVWALPSFSASELGFANYLVAYMTALTSLY
jgi:hypothetical protein